MLTLLLAAALHAESPAAAPAPTTAPTTASAPAPTPTTAGAPADAAATPAAAPTPEAAPAPMPAPAAPAKEEKPKVEISMKAWLNELWHLLVEKGDPSGIGVVATMAGMLFWSVYVGIERLGFYRRARNQSAALSGVLGEALKTGQVEKAVATCSEETYKDSYLATVVRAGLGEYKEGYDLDAAEAAQREIERATVVEQGRLRAGLNVLATTGSTTPFVGLVGTVLGIIRCFGAMNEDGGADLSSLSGGIAEALYSTALGIAVAIVAIWIYNYFNAVMDDITKDITTATQQLVNFMEKDARRRSSAAASK